MNDSSNSNSSDGVNEKEEELNKIMDPKLFARAVNLSESTSSMRSSQVSQSEFEGLGDEEPPEDLSKSNDQPASTSAQPKKYVKDFTFGNVIGEGAYGAVSISLPFNIT